MLLVQTCFKHVKGKQKFTTKTFLKLNVQYYFSDCMSHNTAEECNSIKEVNNLM